MEFKIISISRVASSQEGQKRGRAIPFVERRPHSHPASKPQPAEPPTRPRKRGLANNPDCAHIPAFEELEAEVRRTPIKRTIARVYVDPGIVPSFCTGALGSAILQTLECYGGSSAKLFDIRRKREIAFQRARDKRPETWEWNWRDLRKERMREVLGYLTGEKPPDDPVAAPA